MKKLSQEALEIELHKISTHGDNNIYIEPDDIKYITYNKDLVVMSTAEYNGSYAARQAIILSIADFEQENYLIVKADAILVHFLTHPSSNFMDIVEAMQIIHDKRNPLLSSIKESDVTLKSSYDTDGKMACKNTTRADVIFGASYNNDAKIDCVKVTIFMSYDE